MLTYRLDTFVVPDGQEVFKCQYFPPSGKEAYFNRLHSSMTLGSHHIVVFRIDSTRSSPEQVERSCSQVEIPTGFDALLFASQEHDFGYTLPKGVALYLSATDGIYVQSHYLNTTGHD